MGQADSSTPTFVEYSSSGTRDSYPAWTTERRHPLSKEEIEDIFLDLTQKFGFQRDSMRNMVSIGTVMFIFTATAWPRGQGESSVFFAASVAFCVRL